MSSNKEKWRELFKKRTSLENIEKNVDVYYEWVKERVLFWSLMIVGSLAFCAGLSYASWWLWDGIHRTDFETWHIVQIIFFIFENGMMISSVVGFIKARIDLTKARELKNFDWENGTEKKKKDKEQAGKD